MRAILIPLVFFFIVYPILKIGHEARRGSGGDSISGLELLFWVSAGAVAVYVIACVLGLC